LIGLLDDADWHIRLAVAKALAEIGDPRAAASRQDGTEARARRLATVAARLLQTPHPVASALTKSPPLNTDDDRPRCGRSVTGAKPRYAEAN
jgi:hypothetical protein